MRDWSADDRRYFSHGNEPATRPDPLILVRGKGSTVWDHDGREYLDAHAGAWLSQIGHGRGEMAEVAAGQLSELAHFTTHAEFSNLPAIGLARRLVELSGMVGAKVRYATSGSEAADDALQIVRDYHRRLGTPNRHIVLTVEGCYHGHTYGGLELAGRLPSYMNSAVVQLSCPAPEGTAEPGSPGSTDVCVRELEQTIAAVGADRVAAMFGEPVFGPAGMFAPPRDYWPRMSEVLAKHKILFVADEVVTGLGRTGNWFGSHRGRIQPDLMILAKGLASGYAPISAILLSERVAEVVEGSRAGGSYAGQAAGCALALRNIEIIQHENLVANASERGLQFQDELGALLALPNVAAVTGLGLMIGVHLRGSRSVSELLGESLERAIRREGVIVMADDRRILITPPLVFTSDEVTRTVAAIRSVLTIAADAAS